MKPRDAQPLGFLLDETSLDHTAWPLQLELVNHWKDPHFIVKGKRHNDGLRLKLLVVDPPSLPARPEHRVSLANLYTFQEGGSPEDGPGQPSLPSGNLVQSCEEAPQLQKFTSLPWGTPNTTRAQNPAQKCGQPHSLRSSASCTHLEKVMATWHHCR